MSIPTAWTVRRAVVLRPIRNIALTIVLGLVMILALWFLEYRGFRWSRVPGLNQWEMGRVSDQLGVRLVDQPARFNAWCTWDSAVFGVNVRVDFNGRRLDQCLKAPWLIDSRNLQRSDAERAFSEGAPSQSRSALELWDPLPLTDADMLFHRSVPESGPVPTNYWALVRQRDGVLTAYFVGSGSSDCLSQAFREVFAEDSERIWQGSQAARKGG